MTDDQHATVFVYINNLTSSSFLFYAPLLIFINALFNFKRHCYYIHQLSIGGHTLAHPLTTQHTSYSH